MWNAQPGWALRIAGTLFLWGTCLLAYRFARDWWGRQEGIYAAYLVGLFLTFGIPSAVIALAPDLLIVPVHLAAVYLAWRGRPFWSGFTAGVACLFNAKGLFVLCACLVWQFSAAGRIMLGFAVPNLCFLSMLVWTGALPGYVEQVWTWGAIYTRDTFIANPVLEAWKRTLNWTGFHIVLIIGAGVWWWREKDWRWLAWFSLAFASVFLGWRFFPRYYFALLPPLCVVAGRGIVLIPARHRAALLLLIAIPIVRFAPTYWYAATRSWPDTKLMEDSRTAAAAIRHHARSGETLFVWGYRPDIFVFSDVPAGTPFLDSQPVTGVFADRHLFSGKVSVRDTETNAERLVASEPTWVVDGLGQLNPELKLADQPRLQQWLRRYRHAYSTELSTIYRLR